jgi:hypothetical protein
VTGRLALLLAWTACVPSYIRGRVTDCRDSSPLEGADVQLTAQAAGAQWPAQRTEGDGAYSFKVDDKGLMPVTLTAVKSGYQTAQKNYDSFSSSPQEVCMRPTKR